MKNIREFTTKSGKTILVGKSAKDNNYLTFKLGGETDIFLHTRDFPGSHVILFEENPSKEELHEAAVLAAYFSKGKSRAIVKVDYTQRKNVSRNRKDPPGLVEISHFKTIKIKNPDSEFEKIKRL